jgi:hypothetical protein
VSHDTRRHAGDEDVTDAVQCVRFAQRRRQTIRSLDAVEQRDNAGLRSDEWTHEIDRFIELPGFGGDQHHVNRTRLRWIVGRLDRRNMSVTDDALDL